MPGNILTFNAVSVEEAHAILREQEEVLAAIRRDSARASIAPNLSIAVDGQTFEVLDEAEEPVNHTRKRRWYPKRPESEGQGHR